MAAVDTEVTTTGAIGAGGSDLAAAAEIIADRARELSARWSVRVPASISVSTHGNIATITASAPPARPNELALRHPLFGNRRHWYGPNVRPFLRPAAYDASDAALKRYAQKIDQMAAKAGFR